MRHQRYKRGSTPALPDGPYGMWVRAPHIKEQLSTTQAKANGSMLSPVAAQSLWSISTILGISTSISSTWLNQDQLAPEFRLSSDIVLKNMTSLYNTLVSVVNALLRVYYEHSPNEVDTSLLAPIVTPSTVEEISEKLDALRDGLQRRFEPRLAPLQSPEELNAFIGDICFNADMSDTHRDAKGELRYAESVFQGTHQIMEVLVAQMNVLMTHAVDALNADDISAYATHSNCLQGLWTAMTKNLSNLVTSMPPYYYITFRPNVTGAFAGQSKGMSELRGASMELKLAFESALERVSKDQPPALLDGQNHHLQALLVAHRDLIRSTAEWWGTHYVNAAVSDGPTAAGTGGDDHSVDKLKELTDRSLTSSGLLRDIQNLHTQQTLDLTSFDSGKPKPHALGRSLAVAYQHALEAELKKELTSKL